MFWPLAAAQSAGVNSVSDYRLGIGDTIVIKIYGEEDLGLEVQIGAMGMVAHPLLGDLRVQGLTLAEVERRVTDGLADKYLRNPKVSVSIKTYRKFFITGEVKKPGGYEYQPGLTVHKAVVLAGGLTERASDRKITLIQENDPAQIPHKVKLTNRAGPGDIITVGESFF